MRRGRRSRASTLFVLILVACGGDRAPGSNGAQTSAAPDTAATAGQDTVVAARPNTGAPSAQLDSAAPPQPNPGVVRQAPPTKPAPTPTTPKPDTPKPAAPRPAASEPAAPEPAAPEPAPADTVRPAADTSADTVTAAAEPTAPLRDEYHQAPRDTVDQVAYDGWKQFNLNCARCHGEDVLGTTIAPHLITSVRPGGAVDTKEKFIQVVCQGRPEKGMPAWCPLGLEMQKMEAIYQYVKGRGEGKIGPGRPALRQ